MQHYLLMGSYKTFWSFLHALFPDASGSDCPGAGRTSTYFQNFCRQLLELPPSPAPSLGLSDISYFPHLQLQCENVCSKARQFEEGRLRGCIIKKNSFLFSLCIPSSSQIFKSAILLPTSQELPALDSSVAQEGRLFPDLIYIHTAWVLSVESRISRVKCVSWLRRSLQVFNCAPRLEAVGVLGAAENSWRVMLPREARFQ